MHAEKCPVCGGEGKFKEEQCHGCGGRGWVEIRDGEKPYSPAYPADYTTTNVPWGFGFPPMNPFDGLIHIEL